MSRIVESAASAAPARGVVPEGSGNTSLGPEVTSSADIASFSAEIIDIDKISPLSMRMALSSHEDKVLGRSSGGTAGGGTLQRFFSTARRQQIPPNRLSNVELLSAEQGSDDL